MSAPAITAVRDRRAERVAATRREILDAAWELVRADGPGSLSMRDLGARVGMRAQSLYAYFPSKFAIYDAMFEESNRELLRRLNGVPAHRHPVQELRSGVHVFLSFCVEDQARYQLLFQRAIPKFEPTTQAYAPASEVLDSARRRLRACGVTGQRALDLWTALTGGLAAQQIANDPGGDRWIRLTDDAIDMFLAHFRSDPRRAKR